MPIITTPLRPNDSGPAVADLHLTLLQFGTSIADAEKNAQQFGDSTLAAVLAFRNQHGLPAVERNADPFDESVGLLNVAAAAADGNRAALRIAVRESIAAAARTATPQENSWLARYAVIAFDYPSARKAALRAPQLSDLVTQIIKAPRDPMTQPPRPPEVPYPENFYTYRHELPPEADLNQLRTNLKELSIEQFARDNDPNPNDTSVPSIDEEEFGRAKRSGLISPEALAEWQEGTRNSLHREYTRAAINYEQCQFEVLRYFKEKYGLGGEGTLDQRLALLLSHLTFDGSSRPYMWGALRWRRNILSLRKLFEHCWMTPVGTDGVYQVAGKFINLFYRAVDVGPDPVQPPRERRVDALLVTLAFVWVPLARAEDNRLRRQFDAALQELVKLLALNNSLAPQFRLLCEFIEIPFIRLLKAETLLDQADAEFKARTPAAEPPAQDVTEFQSLKAAQTYLAVKDTFKDEGAYVSSVETAATDFTRAIQQRLADGDTSSPEFQVLGKDTLFKDTRLPTIISAGNTLPGLDRTRKAHESLLKFAAPDGQEVMRETNPRVYAALLTATAHLEQLKAGFNYLGYVDTYVPPWRFQFLLDRGRYFAEHTKNAQREYLNFLSNAEREEFQELSAAQNVEMEKSNVRIETARVDQVLLEVKGAKESAELAEIHADNTSKAFDEYKDYDAIADDADRKSLLGSILGGVAQIAGGLATSNPALVIGGAASLSDSLIGGPARLSASAAQRDLEKHNLERAIGETAKSAMIADTQLAVAQAGLLVAGLQRQAALLRHEFALQNLEFLRNRVLNAEQWYRLVAGIRSVSETYLRYSVELAFLAEQAYEFEADKRLNVIRFDYDLSEVGDFLAADFLMRDLDTLEQDLILTQRQRQQHVRYVLSMAREFPAALQEIRDTGKTTFSLRLEQLEKRFPGLYNLRIGTVDVLPVALLDSTRFSMELTHLGTSQVRLKAQPDTPPGTPSSSPLNTNDLLVPSGGWLAELNEPMDPNKPKNTWPIKLRVTGPETDVFSGLTRQEANAVFAFTTTGQRHAFEALGVAAAWQVDFTARDNQVVPDSLADLLITFTLSGYHDPELRAAIDAFKPQLTALTSFLSARQIFPDAFYDFSRSGRMVWTVPRQMLTLTGDLGRLRNIGVSLRPGVPDVHFSRLMTRLRVNFRINGSGRDPTGVTVLTAIPQISVTQTAPLTVAVRAARNNATELSWDFGDGTPILRIVHSGTTPIAPAEGKHTYAKPGRYVLKLRCVQTDSLSEFRISVVVSRDQKLGDPLVIWPRLAFDTTAKTLTATTAGNDQQTGRILWRVGDLTAEGNSATFKLRPGSYTLDFAAVRELNFRVYSAQRYVKDFAPLPLQGFSATTNRTFNRDGNEIRRGTPPQPVRNALARRLFDPGEISPEDDWTFELIPEEILDVPAGTAIGAQELDLSEIQDVVLSMEYDVTPGGP
jgi:hypothetical protein